MLIKNRKEKFSIELAQIIHKRPGFQTPIIAETPILKDRLNATILAEELSQKKRIINSRFIRSKRLSINEKINPVRNSFEITPINISNGSPKGGIFPNSHITLIKPQIHNVTIITNQNSDKARATISRCIMYQVLLTSS